jgi:hypothetical protein
MEKKLNEEFLTEQQYKKDIGSTTVELYFKFKPFNVLKDNGLPCISHLEARTTSMITGRKGYKSHYFAPEALYDYTSFEHFAEEAIKFFIKEDFITIDKVAQYQLF